MNKKEESWGIIDHVQEAGENTDGDNQFGQDGQHVEINNTSHCYTGMSPAMLGTAMQKSAHRYLLSTAGRGWQWVENKAVGYQESSVLVRWFF